MSIGSGVFGIAAQSLALARVVYQKLDFFTYRVNLRAASRLWEGLRRSIVSPMTGSTAALCNQLIFEEIRFELRLAYSAFHLGMAILTFELLFISRNGKWRSEFTKIVKDFEKNFPMFDIPHTAHRLFAVNWADFYEALVII